MAPVQVIFRAELEWKWTEVVLSLSSGVCRSMIMTTAGVLSHLSSSLPVIVRETPPWRGVGTEPNPQIFLYWKPNTQVPTSSVIWICHVTNRLPARPLLPLTFPFSLTSLQQYFPAAVDVYNSGSQLILHQFWSKQWIRTSWLHHLWICALVLPSSMDSPLLWHARYWPVSPCRHS